MASPVIALAADHAGFELKNGMKARARRAQFSAVVDLGPRSPIPSTIRTWPASWRRRSRMAARSRGCWCAAPASALHRGQPLSLDPGRRVSRRHVDALAREHNDGNVLALGARLIGPEVERDCLLTFFENPLCRGPIRATACARSRCGESRQRTPFARTTRATRRCGRVRPGGRPLVHRWSAKKEPQVKGLPALTVANWVAPQA